MESTAIVSGDRIVGIKCNFPNLLSFSVLAVYLPSSNHVDEDFSEYLDLLWSLYDSLSTKILVVVMGDPGGGMPYMCHMETCRRSGYTFWPSNPRQGVFFRA